MKDDPQAAMMNMMKKLYQDGDQQTKQMIAKAWTENQDKKDTIRNLKKPGMM
jgi:calcyclin binding protein